MLAELSNGGTEDSGIDGEKRRSNTISSVGAAFGSFSHQVIQQSDKTAVSTTDTDNVNSIGNFAFQLLSVQSKLIS